jgi:hypothetical protein
MPLGASGQQQRQRCHCCAAQQCAGTEQRRHAHTHELPCALLHRVAGWQDLKDKFRECGTVVYANVTRGEDGVCCCSSSTWCLLCAAVVPQPVRLPACLASPHAFHRCAACCQALFGNVHGVTAAHAAVRVNHCHHYRCHHRHHQHHHPLKHKRCCHPLPTRQAVPRGGASWSLRPLTRPSPPFRP